MHATHVELLRLVVQVLHLQTCPQIIIRPAAVCRVPPREAFCIFFLLGFCQALTALTAAVSIHAGLSRTIVRPPLRDHVVLTIASTQFPASAVNCCVAGPHAKARTSLPFMNTDGQDGAVGGWMGLSVYLFELSFTITTGMQ